MKKCKHYKKAIQKNELFSKTHSGEGVSNGHLMRNKLLKLQLLQCSLDGNENVELKVKYHLINYNFKIKFKNCNIINRMGKITKFKRFLGLILD